MASRTGKIAQKLAAAVRGAYNSQTTTSLSVGEYRDLAHALGDGDVQRGMQHLRSVDPKRIRRRG